MTHWLASELGPDVPLHFSAFHPDWKMTDIPATPAATLSLARQIAQDAGLNHVYTGNVHDTGGGTTHCAQCKTPLIVRDWYDIKTYRLTPEGNCPNCQTPLAGHFGPQLGSNGIAFGPRCIPVQLST
jgi:pyruvate formate lyase activating enzyme